MLPHENLSLTDMEGEIWKPIKCFEDRYNISNMGRCKRIGRFDSIGRGVVEFIMKQHKNDRGYLSCSFIKNGKKYSRRTNRLVAQAFIPNPENKPQVNHINKVRHDNRVENLEWATTQEDAIHKYTFGDYKHPSGKNSKLSKVFYQYTIGGELIKEWKSLRDARSLGFHRNGIKDAIKGIRKTYRGFIWSFTKLH